MPSLLQALFRNESGGRNIPNTTRGTSSGQAQGYFQITTGTWKDFGGTKYAPTPMQATYEQQAEIASKIPLKRWHPSTLVAMAATGKQIDPNKTLGANLAAHGETASGGGRMSAMKFPYMLHGGARREDAITGLAAPFANALTSLYNAAPPEIQKELALNSAYRSREVQQALWDKSDKTGKTVAAPGHSKHERGTAADLFGFGLKGGGKVSQATKDWVAANAKNYGLYFPMSYEPWHIQLVEGANATGLPQNALPQQGTPFVAGGGSAPGDLSPPLQGEDKDKPLSGLLAEMIRPQQMPAPPDLLPKQGGAQVASLPEYIQQYLATRMQKPQGGFGGGGGGGGFGGQGIG